MNMSMRLSALCLFVSAIACDADEPIDDDVQLRTESPQNCLPGRIDFDGHCISANNIENYVDFDSENMTFLEVEPCDDDPTPADCMDVLVDRGDGNARRVYRIIDDDSTCGTVLNTCFGGWVSPYHIAYTSEATGGVDSYFVHTEARLQWDEHVRIGNNFTVATQHGATHETTSSYQQQEDSSAVDVNHAYRIRDAQGVVVEEFVEAYTMIASGSEEEEDAKERCEGTAESLGNIFGGAGELMQTNCEALPDEITIGDEDDSMSWNIEICEDTTSGRQKVVEGILGLWEEHCKANPEQWFPNMFEANDAVPGADPETIDEMWIDETAVSFCYGESFTNIEAHSLTTGNTTCEWYTEVTYTCGENCHCEKVGESAPLEEVCTVS